ncbi:MAG: MBL fold metallo-hydrolase [Alphaproteobacteria bacterium]|nr:MBL fold metallo-hydrolase [Alphaproteobacteria bacterium]
MRVTVLGSGTAGGTPRIGNDWGACDPAEPRNRRRRASILVEQRGTTLLVDASPDLRQQALDAGIERLDAVLLTHGHADHCHGIDDLRFFVRHGGQKRIPLYGDERTLKTLRARFPYIFRQLRDKLYAPILSAHRIGGPFQVGSIPVVPFVQRHGGGDTLGFRFDAVAYSTDVVEMPDQAFDALAGVDTWIVDCLQEKPHPTHSHLARTLEWIARVRPRRAVLTHINPSLDYRTLVDRLPPGVEPAFDGMVVEVGA